MDQHYLTSLFAPRDVVVFAGDAQLPEQQTVQARALHQALQAQPYTGNLTFLDTHTTGTLADLAHTHADLAIIALPPGQVLAAVEVAGRMKCRAALLISSGISAAVAAELHRVAQHHGMHLLGPNSLGIQRPALGLNASVAGGLAGKGALALVCQSGALTASILDWANQQGVGFSSVVSLGPHTSIDIAHALDFFASDPQTHSIVVYLEGIPNARRFMSSLRAAANTKPVVVLKAGRQAAGNAAAKTHSAAIVGSDDVFDAALRRAGAVRVKSFVELFSATKCLASRYRPVGKRLAIVTNGGGPGVLAADWISELHLQLGVLSDAGQSQLQPLLAPLCALTDLIDLSEESTPEHYAQALAAVSKEPKIDGVLVIYSPKAGCDAAAVAQAVTQFKPKFSKPLLTCWMGDSSVSQAREVLKTAEIPTFRTPEAAVGAFHNIASFYQNQQLLQQTPPPLSTLAKPDIEGARLLIEEVLAQRRNVLTEMESKALLSAFHIPVTKTLLARSSNEAMMIASQLGYPVALKIDSYEVTHKTDVNGVALNVMNATDVRDVYNSMTQAMNRLHPNAKINGITIQNMAQHTRGREVCIGLVTDPALGPVISFGAGGVMIELINDRAMELPPLNQYLARQLIDRSRVAQTLQAWRGAPAIDMQALEQVLLRVSEMVCELPQLREMDINPMIVDAHGAVAVDACIVIDSAQHNAQGRSHSYHHLAILPYPAQYENMWPLPNGDEYTVRPIHPDDAQMLQDLVRSLTPESRYFRFVSWMTELPASMLSRLTLIDYDREMALVAVHKERTVQDDGTVLETQRIVGVSRYITNPDHDSCEFSLVVASDFSGRGLGKRLMLSIMDVAREKGLVHIEGLVLSNNPGMLKLMKSLGFTIKPFPDDPDFRLVVHPL